MLSCPTLTKRTGQGTRQGRRRRSSSRANLVTRGAPFASFPCWPPPSAKVSAAFGARRRQTTHPLDATGGVRAYYGSGRPRQVARGSFPARTASLPPPQQLALPAPAHLAMLSRQVQTQQMQPPGAKGRKFTDAPGRGRKGA